jgi:hypothetical protein
MLGLKADGPGHGPTIAVQHQEGDALYTGVVSEVRLVVHVEAVMPATSKLPSLRLHPDKRSRTTRPAARGCSVADALVPSKRPNSRKRSSATCAVSARKQVVD